MPYFSLSLCTSVHFCFQLIRFLLWRSSASWRHPVQVSRLRPRHNLELHSNTTGEERGSTEVETDSGLVSELQATVTRGTKTIQVLRPDNRKVHSTILTTQHLFRNNFFKVCQSICVTVTIIHSSDCLNFIGQNFQSRVPRQTPSFVQQSNPQQSLYGNPNFSSSQGQLMQGAQDSGFQQGGGSVTSTIAMLQWVSAFKFSMSSIKRLNKEKNGCVFFREKIRHLEEVTMSRGQQNMNQGGNFYGNGGAAWWLAMKYLHYLCLNKCFICYLAFSH